ncbi:nuclear transport factor 2 family protein [Zafaria sp. J156]|jgi:hypothetical protein|uniref:nuclear transport factor 2 family protein n=1 Tax=Micrococcaceae TaxID=1268 RepID=UPI002E774ECE|nr:nuclear transport factor 2 family protein [Zafaria sp. J156]MEE1622750.1 nuclear transport factor 2 family protein [Zafaria sp. J156]
MSKNIKNVPTSDYLAVVETVNAYVEGVRQGNPEKVSEAFRDDATMYGFTDGSLVGGPISNLYSFVKTSGEAPNVIARVDILGIAPTIAVARVDMENDAVGADYTDFHTLLKQDGEWKIVGKVYHQYEK